MLRNPTVFIVGAGASYDAGGPYGNGGFPMAADLAVAIARSSKLSMHRGQRVIDDDELYEAIDRRAFSKEERNLRLDALDAISKGLLPTSSIDSFIYQHSHNKMIEEMGKVQIARHIIRAEANSLLFQRGWPANQLEFATKLGSTWYSRFASMITDQVTRERVSEVGENLTIICFNYDRCLEIALIEAFRANYLLDYVEAIRIVAGLNIIHPYGTLGPLSAAPLVEGSVNFGEETADPWQMARSLRTYAEGAREDGAQERVRDAISGARSLVFMGFAFATQNMNFMALPSAFGGHKQIFSTGIGIKPQSIPELRRRITAMIRGIPSTSSQPWHIEVDTDCLSLLRMHEASFA